jgi:RecA/RadA recombinase
VAQAQRRIEDIESLGKTVEETSFPDSFVEVARPKWPTGVDFVDRIMSGGGEPGDCNVIIGPTGGGKTTLSMQLAASTARLQSQLARRGIDGEPGLVVFVSYEDSLRMLQVRAASYAARVLKDTLMGLKSHDELSSIGNLKPYEQAWYASEKQTDEMLGEQERLEQAKAWIRKYMVMVDYHDPTKGGRGHVTEVRQKLTAIQQDRGMPIRMVVLDWAGNLVANFLQGTDGSVDGSKMSLELQNLVNRSKHEIAAPFNTAVWIPHQLKGQSCKSAPAHFPHHSDAQWCSMFSDHAWFAFVLGTKDREHNVCQFGATKTRHGETIPPVILRIDGAVCRMTDVSQHFEVDEVTRRLIPKSEASKFHANLAKKHDSVDMS